MSALAERFTGCLMGLAVGDALGAPYEGLTSQDIFYRYGSLEALVANPPDETLFYTDDTEMMLGVAETLIEHGEILGSELMSRFAANYHPERGYGRGARQILEAARTGDDWRSLAETIFPGGSLGNGAAMRVAPIGVLFHRDLDRVWDQARLSARPTHRHPVGIEGAQVLALTVALATRSEATDRKTVLKALLERCETEEFQWALRTALRLRRSDSISVLGSTLHAHQSVVTAIMCFLSTPDHFDLAVGRAICLGDDTDTLAAMTGALIGAHGGIQAIPPGLINRLEEKHNGPKGRSYIQDLAQKLWERYRTDTDTVATS